MTVIELKSKLSKGHACVIIVVAIIFMGALYKYDLLLKENHQSRKMSEMDLALKSLTHNIAGRLSVLASANDFIDYIENNGFRNTPLNISSLAARLSHSGYSGLQINNSQEKTIFSYGETALNYITARLCYRSDVLDSKRGRCSHSVTVYFKTQQLISMLKTMNPAIEQCFDCAPIKQMPDINLSDLNLSSSVNLPVRINIPIENNYLPFLWVVCSLFVILASFMAWHYRKLLITWIEQPLVQNNIEPDLICLDKLHMSPLWKHKSEMLELRASTESARDKQITAMIHDQVASPLSSIGFIVSALPLPDNLKENAHGQIQEITRAAYKCMDTLYPEALEKHGLSESLAILMHRCVQQKVTINNSITNEEVDLATSMAAYMIVQESVSNSIKYANATKVKLSCNAYDLDQWELIFQDNGQGYNTNTVKRGRGTLHMNARAKGVGGVFTVISAPGQGTTIKVLLPKKRILSDGQE